MMNVCFLCDSKLCGECAQVCSNITPHSYIPFPEKIAELMGDEVVVIVTPDDHLCKKCTSLLTRMDKLENDLKLVKNAMLYYIQKKYGILPPNPTVKSVKIANGHLKAEEKLEQVQRKLPSGLTIRVSPTVTTAAIVTSVQTPIKSFKTQQQQQKQPQLQQKQQQQQQQEIQPQQQQQQQKIQPQQQQQQQKIQPQQQQQQQKIQPQQQQQQQKIQPQQQQQHQQGQPQLQQKQQQQHQQIQPQQQQQHQQRQPQLQQKQQQQHQQIQPQQQQQRKPQQQKKRDKKMCEYKCGFCSFQSKELGHVRCHIRIHKNEKEPKKLIPVQATAKALTQVPKQKKLIYRCPVCAKAYDSQINCLDHIQENHKRPISSTSNGETKTEDSCLITTKVMKPSKTQENNQQKNSMDVDKNRQDYNKVTIDTDTMLNYSVPSEGSANIKYEEKTGYTQVDYTVKEAKLKIKLESAQVEEKEDEEDTTVIKQEEADQETRDN